MPGEIWRQQYQLGKEATEATIVPATRKVYYTGAFKRERAIHDVKVYNGTRSNTIAARPRAITNASGDMKMSLSVDEMIEPLLMTVQGAVAPTTTLGASTWVFKPNSNAVDTATMEWYDGYRGWVLNGCKGESIKLTSTVNGDISVDWVVWARDRVAQTITPALTDRIPIFDEGWEQKVYIDAIGATPGTTQLAGAVIASEVTISNHLGRKFYANNTAVAGDLPLGPLEVHVMLTVEGNAAGFAEYNNWDPVVNRLVRLEYGNNGAVIGTSALKRVIQFDVPGAWRTFDLTPEDQNTKVYKMELDYIYDPTNAFGLQVTATSSRAVAWI